MSLASHTNWHEGAVFQWSEFGQSSAGNDVVATISSFSLSSPFFLGAHAPLEIAPVSE